jgi:hypothetical protein
MLFLVDNRSHTFTCETKLKKKNFRICLCLYDFQVVSPVTGRVLGTKEIRVLNERISISSMKVQVISGVQLSLFPDSDSDNQFVAETTMTSKLSAKYQVSWC